MPPPVSPSPTPTTDPVRVFLDSLTGHLPTWVRPAWLLLIPTLVWLFLPQQVTGGLRWLAAHLRAHHAKGDPRRAHRRGRFASAMAARVADLSAKEDWQDDRFAELEAEVEVHGRQDRWPFRRRRETIRRVPSLSVALENSRDPIVLLEGEPGSGKSVAMRHLAVRMAGEVKRRPSETGVIPIYLNLKEFRPTGAVDVQAVRTFVKETINRANDHLIEKFIEDEFDRGIDEGTWLFLFDSFDEIPAVLGAVQADDLIESYATALYNFLAGMGRCRGVIASREFRGPGRISWPRFRVLRLTERQQRELVRKLDLPLDIERRFLGDLAVAEPSIRQLADNPLVLSLLCEHQRDGHDFPRSSHTVFEAYIAKRFTGDDARLQRRFGISAAAVRAFAEQAAFSMAAEPGLGLSPTRPELLAAIRHQGYDVSEPTGVKMLNALEYLRLARSVETAGDGSAGFTFSHRRFQEYFATCLVLSKETRVEPRRLLTDGRWRETAVTIMQTQSDEAVAPLLAEAERLLAAMVNATEAPDDDGADGTRSFDWPAGSLHLLGLLQAGLVHGGRGLPPRLQSAAARLLTLAHENGQLHDRRWAVDVCLVAEEDTAHGLLRKAFASSSGWLREAAYAQTGRLAEIPPDLRQEMRRVLSGLAAGGQLRRQRLAIDAQLRRLSDPGPERLLKNLFIAVPLIDAVLLAVLGCWVSWFWPSYAIPAVVVHASLYIYRDTFRLDWQMRYSIGRMRWFYAMCALLGPLRDPAAFAELAFFLRFIIGGLASFFLLRLIRRSPEAGLESAALTLAGLYVCSWGYLAVRADRILDRPTAWKIPLLPILSGSHLLLSGGHRLGRTLGRVRFRDAVAVVAFGLMLGVPAALVLLAFLHAPHWLLLVFTVVAFAGYTMHAFRAAKSVLGGLAGRWRDRALLRNVDKGLHRHHDFASMLATLASFHTDHALLLFVQDVKRRRVAAEHPGALRALRLLGELGERATQGRQDRSALRIRTPLDPAQLEPAKEWAAAWISGRKAVSQAVLDEIGKIVADAEFARHAAPLGAAAVSGPATREDGRLADVTPRDGVGRSR